MFRYYSRLSELRDSTTFYSDNILLKNAFIEDCNLANSGEKSWLKSLKDFQSHCKIESLNTSQEQFFDQSKSLYLEDINKQIENIRDNQSGKLSFYCSILNTSNFEIQSYLTFPFPKKIRSNLTKLRISAHRLFIETGRYSKPPVPRESRFCYHCKSSVEDETHFLVQCPKYVEYRIKHSPAFHTECIKEVINPTNYIITKHICCYIQEAFERRKLLTSSI